MKITHLAMSNPFFAFLEEVEKHPNDYSKEIQLQVKLQREMLRLYAVTDSKWLGKQTLAQAVEQAIQGGVTLVQYREKHLTGAAYAKEAAEVAAVCRRHGVPFLVNDRVEEALALGADGVHIGQKDGNPAEIRRRLGEGKILGVTSKTVAQAQAAQAAGADYLGVGAVLPTSTKADAIGLAGEGTTIR